LTKKTAAKQEFLCVLHIT